MRLNFTTFCLRRECSFPFNDSMQAGKLESVFDPFRTLAT
jgi:hypothetical protein